jgi:hypothetical protein
LVTSDQYFDPLSPEKNKTKPAGGFIDAARIAMLPLVSSDPEQLVMVKVLQMNPGEGQGETVGPGVAVAIVPKERGVPFGVGVGVPVSHTVFGESACAMSAVTRAHAKMRNRNCTCAVLENTKLLKIRKLIFAFMGIWGGLLRWTGNSIFELAIALSGAAAKVQPLGNLARPKVR